MKTLFYHPFRTEIFKKDESDIFSVNSGKVFNFYNPLNYRNVRCKINGKPLPELQYYLSEDRKDERDGTIGQTSFILKPEYFKVNIHLFASFVPPEQWVPGPSYIPFLDNAWIACKVYLDDEDKSKFEVIGKVTNSKESNIELESFDVNKTETNSNLEYLYNKTINWGGNAMNLGPIASIYKDKDNAWTVDQFLKENYPLTSFFDAQSFELMNTELYDINISRSLKDEEIALSNQRIGNKKVISSFIGRNSQRGFIKHNKNVSIVSNSSQYIFPNEENKVLESIDNEYDFYFDY
jgi:hypothetical protein